MHALLYLIEEKQRLLELLNAYIDGAGLTVVIGAEHLDREPAAVQLRAVDLRRRRRNRNDWGHRTDAHALLAGDRRRRRRSSGSDARAPRSQLAPFRDSMNAGPAATRTSKLERH